MANVQDRGAPSTASLVLATAIVAGLAGYFVGQARSLGLLGRGTTPSPAKRTRTHPDSDTELSDSDSEGGDGESDVQQQQQPGELARFPDRAREECKLVLVVRTDLGMTKGKIAAQCSHATLACYKALLHADPAHPLLRRWEARGQAKVALKVAGEEELLLLQARAVSLGLCAQVIHDAGRTQIASGSATVLGVGPAPRGVVDEVTGALSLL